MLGNAQPTPYDLRFSLFGIPVRVHPLFWLISAVMGWREDLNLTLIWIGCVFFSVLVHELGHAIAARAFGWPPQIVLYAMGGYASFLPTYGYTMGRAVVTLLAGPGAGFVLYGLLAAGLELMIRSGERPSDLMIYVFLQLKFINLWWGLVNLLPVYPLDGGQISRELFSHWQGRRGLTSSLQLSLVAAVGIALYAFTRHEQYIAILFALLAVESYQALQQDRS